MGSEMCIRDRYSASGDEQNCPTDASLWKAYDGSAWNSLNNGITVSCSSPPPPPLPPLPPAPPPAPSPPPLPGSAIMIIAIAGGAGCGLLLTLLAVVYRCCGKKTHRRSEVTPTSEALAAEVAPTRRFISYKQNDGNDGLVVMLRQHMGAANTWLDKVR